MKQRIVSMLVVLVMCLGLCTQAMAVGFSDVQPGAWYADAVTWAVERNITNGTGDNKFSPNNSCTQAQILTFLWRAMNSPEPEISNPFMNVTESNYYYKPALWAYEKDLVSDVNFGANSPCTRSMTVMYMWILAGRPTEGTSNFTDVSDNSSLAAAVAWAVKNDITNGTSENTFSPSSTCTRGQIVTFLHRFSNAILNTPPKTIKYYDEFPTVPDFGAFAGVKLEEKKVDLPQNVTGVGSYIYPQTKPEVQLEYMDLLINEGFSGYRPNDINELSEYLSTYSGCEFSKDMGRLDVFLKIRSDNYLEVKVMRLRK